MSPASPERHQDHRFSSVVLVDRRGWLLLQERDEFPVIDPEKWGFVGGGVEPGEDYETAAYRELAEETGLRLPDDALRFFDTFEVLHQHCGGYDEFSLWVAGAGDLTDADVECGEGRRIVFVAPEALAALPLTSAAGLALPVLLGSETYQDLLG